MKRLLAVLLLLGATFALWSGWTEDLIEVRRLFFWKELMSMWEALMKLREDEKIALFSLVFAFTFIFPALKIALLYIALISPSSIAHNITKGVAVVGKWSMLDVMIIALVVIAVKSTGLGSVQIHEGVWYFAAAVFLSTIAQYVTHSYVHAATISTSTPKV